MKCRCILESYLFSLLSKITNPEHTNQFKLVKDLDSNKVNDLLMNRTIPVTLSDNLLTFRDTDKKFEVEGALFKMIIKKEVESRHC